MNLLSGPIRCMFIIHSDGINLGIMLTVIWIQHLNLGTCHIIMTGLILQNQTFRTIWKFKLQPSLGQFKLVLNSRKFRIIVERKLFLRLQGLVMGWQAWLKPSNLTIRVLIPLKSAVFIIKFFSFYYLSCLKGMKKRTGMANLIEPGRSHVRINWLLFVCR